MEKPFHAYRGAVYYNESKLLIIIPKAYFDEM